MQRCRLLCCLGVGVCVLRGYLGVGVWVEGCVRVSVCVCVAVAVGVSVWQVSGCASSLRKLYRRIHSFYGMRSLAAS